MLLWICSGLHFTDTHLYRISFCNAKAMCSIRMLASVAPEHNMSTKHLPVQHQKIHCHQMLLWTYTCFHFEHTALEFARCVQTWHWLCVAAFWTCLQLLAPNLRGIRTCRNSSFHFVKKSVAVRTPELRVCMVCHAPCRWVIDFSFYLWFGSH